MTLRDKIAKAIYNRPLEPGKCIACQSEDVDSEDFRDELSRREFSISRLCQKCQDGVFENGED